MREWDQKAPPAVPGSHCFPLPPIPASPLPASPPPSPFIICDSSPSPPLSFTRLRRFYPPFFTFIPCFPKPAVLNSLSPIITPPPLLPPSSPHHPHSTSPTSPTPPHPHPRPRRPPPPPSHLSPFHFHPINSGTPGLPLLPFLLRTQNNPLTKPTLTSRNSHRGTQESEAGNAYVTLHSTFPLSLFPTLSYPFSGDVARTVMAMVMFARGGACWRVGGRG